MTNINRTAIKFDDKLKSIISDISRDYNDEINKLGTFNKSGGYDRENPSRFLRGLFDASFNTINFTTPKTSFNKPDYFALFMCLINDNINEINRWEDVMENLEIDIGLNHNLKDYTCCCGQAIKHSCLVYLGDKGCIVGNCCVEKNIITNDIISLEKRNKLSKKFKKIKQQQKDEIEKRKKKELEQQEQLKIDEFKKDFPYECYDCKGNCKPQYERCYKCSCKKKGMIPCSCGSGFHDKKYKRCFECQKNKN